MPFRTLLLCAAIAVVAVFAALNWPVFMAPTALNLGFTSVQAPLGLVMLGALVIITLAFVAYMATWQARTLSESRMHAKEMARLHTLADKAEASRIAELRALVVREGEQMNAQLIRMQNDLRQDIRANANSLAATIGEMDDRLQRDAIHPRVGPVGMPH